jgi:hypothetical protein
VLDGCQVVFVAVAHFVDELMEHRKAFSSKQLRIWRASGFLA